MSVFLVVLLGWIALGLETGLKQTLALKVGSAVGAPSFVIPLAAFIALTAPTQPALWACLALGFMMDLTAPRDGLTVVGPYAIGLVIACQFILAVRGLVIRRNPLTLVVTSVVAAAICHIWVAAVFTARRFIDTSIAWDGSHELASRLLSSVLTGGTALVMALVLLPLAPMLGLASGHARPWGAR